MLNYILTIVTWAIGRLRNNQESGETRLRRYRAHDVSPKAGSSYDINEDPVMLRAIFGMPFPGEEDLVTALYADIINRHVDTEPAFERFTFRLRRQNEMRRIREGNRFCNTVVNCIDVPRLQMVISGTEPERRPQELRYIPGDWLEDTIMFNISNCEKPFESYIRYDGVTHRCSTCGSAARYWAGCEPCSKLFYPLGFPNWFDPENWPALVWYFLDCPSEQHQSYLRDPPCERCEIDQEIDARSQAEWEAIDPPQPLAIGAPIWPEA